MSESSTTSTRRVRVPKVRAKQEAQPDQSEPVPEPFEDQDIIQLVNNRNKLKMLSVPNLEWFDTTIKAKGLAGHASISYTFLDPVLLPAFVERWHETNNFHMPVGEITLTLDNVSVLCISPLRDILWTTLTS
ncbi:serine/threonine-protein phosphatase 7 long form-like protein [Trifolium medium]|uniref:Serine/threonine-protein phosphatase 7 long form-like protein n=1 Tax=Trifolium medium TaxID=97028 RepID=A0A392N5H4_9FABA|nr:serine/threonine-protein phosphatase 7 long form-like protein [Trifolium medium]